ncbi:DUF1501 domain-containing protein, partial [Singulisphaera rosea]
LRSGGYAAPASTPDADPLAAKAPHFAPRAKRVIFLFMAGAPSHLELFDNKPQLTKFDGTLPPAELIKGYRAAFINPNSTLLGPKFKFAKHGQSGAELSELLPNLAEVADDIAIVKSMVTDAFNHAPGQIQMSTGSQQFGRPSLGSWATYGLGSESRDLPGFIVFSSGSKGPSGGNSNWGNGFLPTVHQGVMFRSSGDPVLYLSNPRGVDSDVQRDSLNTVRRLNQMRFDAVGDPEIATRISSYEMAFRMQASAPEAMDLSREPKQVLEMYGAEPGKPSFANNCLLARRLVESGVRFVQLYDWGWDHHGVSPGEHIPYILPIKVQQIDRAITALVTDLKQRGLLDSTLIVWGGEFGRTPMQQNNAPNQPYIGRDHHPYAFTMMLAGGGIKGGQTYGQTDEIGYYITENPMDVRDLQATILHLLGLDPWKLTYSYQGLEQRLIGVEGKAKLHQALLA